MDKYTGEKISETDHIRQSISDILTTPIGSRVMRRDYGSRLYELIDRPITAATILQIAAASVMAIKRWEHRIEVSRFFVDYQPDQPQQITAEIDCIDHQHRKITFSGMNIR